MGKEAAAQEQQGTVLANDGQQPESGEDNGLQFGLDEKESKPAESAPSPEAEEEKESGEEKEPAGGEENPEDQPEKEESGEEEMPLDDDIPLSEQNKFSEKEKGLYQALRKERVARQKIEAELEYIRLHQKYAPKPAEPEETPPANEPDPVDEALKDKTDEDILTVADVKKLLQAQTAKAERAESRRSDEQAKRAGELKELAVKVSAAEDKLRPTLKGYDEAVHYARSLMDAHPGLKADFNRIVRTDGAEAAAKWAYTLGKGHREFGTGKFVAQDPKAKAREAAKKAIDNSAKAKTSAGAGPGNKTPLNVSHQELMDMEPEDLARTLSSMSEQEYSKIPKAIRTKALQAL